MRTTLTLDPDVAALVERALSRPGQRLKEVINSALRIGLIQLETPTPVTTAFRTESVSLGACRLASLDNVAEALALAEGDAYP